jgi:hypothetical protein
MVGRRHSPSQYVRGRSSDAASIGAVRNLSDENDKMAVGSEVRRVKLESDVPAETESRCLTPIERSKSIRYFGCRPSTLPGRQIRSHAIASSAVNPHRLIK